MSKQQFTLINDTVRADACYAAQLAGKDTGELYEMILRPVQAQKTIKQLGGIFGVWIKELGKRHGESELKIKLWLYRNFLTHIYRIEAFGIEQEIWLELDSIYKERQDFDRYKANLNRVTLAWATLQQTKEFMNAIEQHYQAIGEPLQVLDKFYKSSTETLEIELNEDK